MTRRTAWFLGFTGGLVFFGSAITFGDRFDWARHYRLMNEHVDAVGTITGTEPHSHGLARYEFEANGRQYHSASTNMSGARVGDKITVYYLSDDPSFSTPIAPGSFLTDNVLIPVIVSMAGGFLAAWRAGKRLTARVAPGE